MAVEEALKSISLDADASIGIYTGVPGQAGSLSPNSGKQFRFVKVTGHRIAGLAVAADGVLCIGVLQNKPQQVGDAATVGIFGVSMVEAGAAIAAGAPLKIDSTSRPITGIAGTDVIVGIALDASAAAGELISVLLKVNG